MGAFSFLSPVWLMFLPLVLLMPFLAKVRWQDMPHVHFRHAFVHRFLANTNPIVLTKPTVRDGLIVLTGVLIIVALARPVWQLSQGTEVVAQQQSDAMMVLEASVSMLLTEAEGQSRLTQSQHWLAQLLTQRDVHARTGLVVFGDDAYQVLSATTDVSLLTSMIERINPALAGRGDSALLEGLTLGIAELVKRQSSSGWVVLIHDGAQSALRGSLAPLLAWAKQHEIRLAVVSVGGLQEVNQDRSGLLYSPRSDVFMQQLAAMGAITAHFDDASQMTALQAALLQAQQQTNTQVIAGKSIDLLPHTLLLVLLVWGLPWLFSRRST